MPRYTSALDIYGRGPIYSGVSTKGKPVGGGGSRQPTVCPPVSCDELQVMDDYIMQITRILTNLENNKKVTNADNALDNMMLSLSNKIEVVAASK